MRITYDRDANAAYIHLGDAGSTPDAPPSRPRPDGVDGFVALDWKDDRLVGIEILDADTRLRPDLLEHAEDTTNN